MAWEAAGLPDDVALGCTHLALSRQVDKVPGVLPDLAERDALLWLLRVGSARHGAGAAGPGKGVGGAAVRGGRGGAGRGGGGGGGGRGAAALWECGLTRAHYEPQLDHSKAERTGHAAAARRLSDQSWRGQRAEARLDKDALDEVDA